jgi:septal ring factor EnvC (AmiA/AmiB activator)
MADVVEFPGERRPPAGGSGPEDPMIEARVARLEEDIKDVKASLKSIETKLTSIAESIAEIKGKVSQSPTWLQLLVALIATWGAGAAIVAVVVRFAYK